MDRLLSQRHRTRSACRTVAVRNLAPPAWARDLVASAGDHFRIVSSRVADAADLTPRELEQRTFDAYVTIAQQISRSTTPHAVRFWNHVPFITDPADGGRDNYMVFNAGRFRAFTDWFGGAGAFERHVATASATGHWGRDL